MLRGKNFINFESLNAFNLELYIIPLKKVREKGLLVDDSHKCAIQIERVIGVTLFTDDTEIFLIEAF